MIWSGGGSRGEGRAGVHDVFFVGIKVKLGTEHLLYSAPSTKIKEGQWIAITGHVKFSPLPGDTEKIISIKWNTGAKSQLKIKISGKTAPKIPEGELIEWVGDKQPKTMELTGDGEIQKIITTPGFKAAWHGKSLTLTPERWGKGVATMEILTETKKGQITTFKTLMLEAWEN